MRIRPQPPRPIPSEFEQGLANRKPVYLPFPQAVPCVPVIDKDTCVYFKTGGCKVCEDACQVRAIDHTMQDRVEEIEVGNIVIATGWKPFDCTRIPQYGYGRLPNVFTNLEFERLCNAAGPTNGKIVLRDGKTEPKRIAIVHCVGSRDVDTQPLLLLGLLHGRAEVRPPRARKRPRPRSTRSTSTCGRR